MDYYKIPQGLAMALSMDPTVLNVWSAMTESEKQGLLKKICQAQSKQEMDQLVFHLRAPLV